MSQEEGSLAHILSCGPGMCLEALLEAGCAQLLWLLMFLTIFYLSVAPEFFGTKAQAGIYAFSLQDCSFLHELLFVF